MTDQILITQVPARLQGVLGTEVRCTQHGLIAWVKTSLVGSVIAGHVMRFHSLKENGSSDRAIG